jgi:hypothetical protein
VRSFLGVVVFFWGFQFLEENNHNLIVRFLIVLYGIKLFNIYRENSRCVRQL